MLPADEREKLERDFAEAEASVRLEGFSPSANFFAVKARVLAGEITFEQGREDILSYHRTKNSAVA
jgi:antitoxin HigA-1